MTTDPNSWFFAFAIFIFFYQTDNWYDWLVENYIPSRCRKCRRWFQPYHSASAYPVLYCCQECHYEYVIGDLLKRYPRDRAEDIVAHWKDYNW